MMRAYKMLTIELITGDIYRYNGYTPELVLSAEIKNIIRVKYSHSIDFYRAPEGWRTEEQISSLVKLYRVKPFTEREYHLLQVNNSIYEYRIDATSHDDWVFNKSETEYTYNGKGWMI